MRIVGALACVAVLAAGCGPAAQEPLFPLEEGRHWHYAVTTAYDDGAADTVTERFELRARGAADFGGAAAFKRTSSSGMAYWLRSDDTGVYRVATQGPLDEAPRRDAAARYVLKKPIAVGTEWQADTTAYVLRRRNEFPPELRHLARYRSLPMKYRIALVDAQVETPAGRFERCVRVDGTGEIHLYVDELFAVRPVPFTTREWYCPQVGLVKLERIERSPTRFLAGGSITMDLVGYQ
jgi:hypothetical protein